MDPVLVAGFVTLATIVVVFIFRVTGNEDALKKAESITELMNQVIQAATIAVTEVDATMKETEGMSNVELKAYAVDVAIDILQGWGITVTPAMANQLGAVIEWAYQQLKANKVVEGLYKFQ